MDGFNRVWTSPNTLPTTAEIAASGGLGGPGAAAARPGLRPRPSRQVRLGRYRGRGDGRRAQPRRPQPDLVLVACSGGADSLALAAALAFEAPRLGGPRRRRSPSTTACRTARPTAPRGRRAPARPRPGPGRGRGRDRGPPGRARGRRPGRPLRRARRRRRAPRRRRRAARPHPRRPGRDRAARAGPRLRHPVAGRHGRRSPARRPLPPPAAASWTATPSAGPAWPRASAVGGPAQPDPAYTRSRVRHEALPVLEKCARARASSRRWPAPRGCPRTTPTPSTTGRADGRAGRAGRRRQPRRARLRRAAARGAPPGAAPRRARRGLAGRASSPPATSRRSTGWSPTGAGRGRSTCPGGVTVRRSDDRHCSPSLRRRRRPQTQGRTAQ